MSLSKLWALMVWAIKQFNANLNWACFVVKMRSVKKGKQQNAFPSSLFFISRKVRNVEVTILVAVIYYAVIIIIALLIAISDIFQATRNIIAIYAWMVH